MQEYEYNQDDEDEEDYDDLDLASEQVFELDPFTVSGSDIGIDELYGFDELYGDYFADSDLFDQFTDPAFLEGGIYGGAGATNVEDMTDEERAAFDALFGGAYPDTVYGTSPRRGTSRRVRPSEGMNVQFDPVTGLPIYNPTSPVIFEQAVQIPEQGEGGGGSTTTTTTTTGGAASGGTGTGVRPITLPTGQVIYVPENLSLDQLLTQNLITREIYEQLSGDSAIAQFPTTLGSGESYVSDLSKGGLRRNMNEEEEEDFGDDDGLGDSTGDGDGTGTGTGTGIGTGYGGTGQGGAGGAGGAASVVFNPYQPTLSPFELGEYGRLIPSTQSGVLPELADFMNYYGATVPGMTQQMAGVTGAGQTAFAQQLLGMEGDRISAFDIAQEASRQQRGSLANIFGLGPDATYADITAAGTAPMEALSQVRGTVLPGLESAFQTAQERLEKGLTGRERQQVEQATRARFGALGRGADTAALATEIGDIMQEERGLYSRNLQDLLGIGQTTGSLIGQEAYAMSPFTQAAIGAADLGPGLALAGDIGRQAAAATPSPTDLFGLEAGERQFGLDLEALEAAASAGDLSVVSSMLGTIGSAFRGGPYAGLQQQTLGTPTYTGMPIGQSFNPFGFNLGGF